MIKVVILRTGSKDIYGRDGEDMAEIENIVQKGNSPLILTS